MMKNVPQFSYVAQKLAALFVLAMSFALIANVANASKRVALVIGNSAYEHATPLKNPRNDAEDLAEKLIELGFDVVSGFDLDSRGLRDKVRDFGNKLRGADVAMFFYAGHALQVNGRNYLAPVNTDIRHEGDLDFETIPMDFVQRQMERETKTVLLFLDACRDNPLARNLRKSSRSTGATRGLARETNSSEGTFIAFATQPNNVALDGDGRNSPFTTALLKNIDRPGIEISTLMTDVRRQVFETTDEQQIPWINSSLLGRFYFKGGEGDTEGKVVASLDDNSSTTSDVSTTPAPVKKAKPVVKKRSNEDTDQLLSMRLEQLAWEAVKDSSDVDELSAFINAYGTGFFGDLAKLRLAKIEKNKPAVADKSKETKVASLGKTDESRKIVVEKTIRDEPDATAAPKVVTREITRQIQAELNRIGCSAGSPDGLWGKKSVRATGLYAKHAKVRLATLQPTHDLLDELKAYNKRICPAPKVAPRPVKKQVKTCQPGQKLSRKGNCYWPKVKQAKTCQPGQKLSRKGNCYWPKQNVQPQPQVVRCQAGQQVTRNGQCFWPQQPRQQVIIQQRQPQVIQQPQPQRRNNGGLLGGIVGGVIVNCGILKNC